jgi:hypothetical protein
MNEDQIREWLLKNGPPKPNSVRAHNEQVEWNAVNPDLKSVDVEAGARLFRNHILCVDGWPEHWFVSGADVNRASAVEMGDPIVKSLTARQKVVMAMVRAQIRYMLRCRVSAGSLPRTVEIEKAGKKKILAPWDVFEINAPEIASRDLARLGSVLVQVAQALVIAQSNQWVGHNDVAGIFAMVASMFGREVTPAEAPDTRPEMGPGGQDYTPDVIAEMRRVMSEIRGQESEIRADP